MTSYFTKALLLASSAVAFAAGAYVTFAPVALHASAGVVLNTSASLMSEVRAPGGVLLAGGVLMAAGAFIARVRHTALTLSALIYLSYGVTRLFSIGVDGLPHDNLIAATVLELMLGVAALSALIRGDRSTVASA